MYLFPGETWECIFIGSAIDLDQWKWDNSVGKIGRGLNLLVGIANTDTSAEIDWLVRKCLELRLFPDEDGDDRQKSVQEIGGDLLVVSQFTLYGDCL